MSFYDAGRREGTFDRGIELATRAVLVSPEVRVPCRARSGWRDAGQRVSRSAIWSSRRGCRSFCGAAFPMTNCSTSPVAVSLASLPCSTRRFGGCSPIRARSALVDNFAGQWLQIRNLRNTTPDKNDFPDFDDNLRQAFERELELFVGSIIAEDRSVLDLMTADYTFVNERLAKHYGIPNVYGPALPPVSLTTRMRPRSAGQGRRAAADVACRSHVAGGSRQMDSRQPAGHAAAAGPGGGATIPGRGAGRAERPSGRMEQHRCEPGVRGLPQGHGSARAGARELRCGRRLAYARIRHRRSTRLVSSPTARRSTASPRCETRC